ncbi:hypothetical protein [Paenibacillus sp. JJ-100]|uniref:hypothetical protein n=1 Tax=Paenibacillus sp. JJ-100 TaxID=2974896 RepID=UPI00232DBF4D|nr:hypothetical protein [Paenibacillus sp. JJ-100]
MGEEDQMVYHMPHIEKLIAEYDARPPFDEKKCKEEFKEMMECSFQDQVKRLPRGIYDQIADIRVFTLGYCTREVMRQLKKQSAENTKLMDRVLK